MPPKRKAGAGRKPKGKLLQAQVLPIGQVLTDLTKKCWSLGAKVGMGGCGEIFLAAPHGESFTPDEATHVIKIEPHANGPLFSELAFYHRAAKADMINSWQKSHKDVSYVGVPAYVAEGWHEEDGKRWRFMVMVRFGEDLESLFTKHGRLFSLPTVCALAINLLHSLEYLHSNEYVHADIKGANLLIGRTKPKRHEVFLVDYGLAYRYLADGKHRAYQEDPRCLHDGTIEFTSRDAHKGVRPSRRGDMEILGFVLVQWVCGSLPWESKIENKDVVAKEKEKFMKNPSLHLTKLFSPRPVPSCLQSYFSEVGTLEYEQQPDYAKLASLFTRELSSLKLSPKSTAHLDWLQTGTPSKRRNQSDNDAAIKKPAGTRVKKYSKRISASGSSEEDSTPKKKTKFNSTSPASKKSLSIPLSKQGLRRSPRNNKGLAPSKTLRDKRKAIREEISPIQISTDEEDISPIKRASTDEDSFTKARKSRFGIANDEYSFRYDDQVVVPASPSIPSPAAMGRFSPSIPLVRPTDAMREVASRAGKRKAANKGRKKQAAVNESEDELEIISLSSNPTSKAKKTKSGSASNSSVNGNLPSNPTPEMLLVMSSKSKTRKRK